jgi:threonine dehydrogenase-like Zn-dependent dehydrogenase
MERLLRLLQRGRVDPTPLTTHVFSFASIDAAFETMRTKSDGIIKPIVAFNEVALPKPESKEAAYAPIA